MSKKAKILIVDDKPANLRALQVMLADLEVEIIEANSGNEALAHTLKKQFALILLDVQMPEMSGYEVASILKDNPDTTNIPILFLTAAFKDEAHQIQGYQSGAVDYITKPIVEEFLIPKVRFFLQLFYYQQQIEESLEGEKRANERLQNEIEIRARLEHDLTQALKKAEVATKSKAEFLATMSHEIRTPMNGVLGMAELLGKTTLTNEQQDKLNMIMSSGSLLMTIINDILDFSKLEAGQVELESIPFNLARTIHDEISLLSVRTEDKNAEFILDYPTSVPQYFKGDPSRIRQILNNLLSNATKFTHDGHIIVNVDAHVSANNHSLLTITVEDTGIGIDQQTIQKLFTSFTQADNSTTRKYGGTGLGLSICKQLIEIMGGRIWVESILGQGSKFIFEVCLPNVESPQRFKTAKLSGAKVLLVDDNHVNRVVYGEVLNNFGVEATILNSPLEVLKTISEAEAQFSPFDIAILDYNMPVQSGLELGKVIRKNKAFDQLKLAVLTSSAARGDTKYFREAGFDAYLSKPILADTLHDALVSLLQQDGDSSTEQTSLVTKHSIGESKELDNATFSGKVLVVEDITINQLIIQSMLEDMGLAVEIANNGQEALTAFQEHDFDLILMDCQMPVMDGYKATQEIRNIETAARLPIIALTANAMAEDRAKCIAAGMDDFVTKPFSEVKIREMLHKWLKPA